MILLSLKTTIAKGELPMSYDVRNDSTVRLFNEIQRRGIERRIERKKGAQGSIHKSRAGWFQGRAAWPQREAPVDRLTDARRFGANELEPFPAAGAWTSAGPTNIGGRMTSVVAHPTLRNLLWAGSAGGGVWRSRNAGNTWEALWHDQPILNIGSVAIDPQNPRTLYAGTGEANLSADSYPGVGVYRSLNSGGSWRLIAPGERTGIPSRIGALAVDPFDSNRLILGGISYSDDHPGGLFLSDNGGFSWQRSLFVSDHNYWCHAVVFHPSEAGVVYTSVTEKGSRSGLWRSLDGGTTWQQLTGGLPPAEEMHRTSLALCQSQPNVLYAQVAAARLSRLGSVLGVWRSDDGGNTWRQVDRGHFVDERQMTYNNTIAVNPADPDRVICGGVDLHRTTDGGQTWFQVTDWRAQRGSPTYAHADQHALLIPVSDPDRIYALNDGGMDVSFDRGRSWTNRSDNLAVTMFYDLAIAASDSRVYGGGAQDNGTIVTFDDRPDNFLEVSGGDGGFIVFDPQDAGHFYTSFQRMGLLRFRLPAQMDEVTVPAEEAERRSVWMAYVAMSPQDPLTVFTGSVRIWRTRDDAVNWEPVSEVLDGSPVKAIEIAVADPERIYAGTENGGFFRSTDGGDSWSADLAGAEIPDRTITRIAAHPNNADLVFATVANYGHSHVFRSEDGGISWRDVDGGTLPDAPLHSAALLTGRPDSVVVVGDAGVFITENLGETWRNLTGDLPSTQMVDVVHHSGDDTLTVATYGRSLWRLEL